jgi:hypothetical protein
MEGEMVMKYEVSISDGFGDPNVVVVNTAGGFARAIKMALDSHYDDEEEVVEITSRRVKE